MFRVQGFRGLGFRLYGFMADRFSASVCTWRGPHLLESFHVMGRLLAAEDAVRV